MIAAAKKDKGNVTSTVSPNAAQLRTLPAPTLADFMLSVVPWPTDMVGHVNLHYSKVNPRASEPGQEPLLKGMGWPLKDISTFIQRAAWANNQNNFKDVWFCTSRQRETARSPQGKLKALRRKANAIDLKAIWVDIDVKPDDTSGKYYASIDEAWAAINAFRIKVGLPPVSAVVDSGGGLHIYWISDRALEPAQWLPFAAGLKALLLKEGVKCDAGLTTDDVRLLRVPGTRNHKYDPPRVVRLMPIPLTTYNFETSLAFLTTIAPVKTVPAASTALFEAATGVKPIIVQATDCLSDGIEKREEVLLDPRPVFTQCGFMGDALATGGADLDNPLWHLSVLATTFMENGNAIAHQISEKHADYTPDGTQALFDRKVADRADRGIGYPQCSTIAGNGCKSCATCPLRGKVKSPLNIRPIVTAAVNGTSSPSGSGGQAIWTGRPGISFSNIPHRQWLYGFDLVRGELTVIGSPGGAGKSSLAIGMAICVATNRELLGEKIRGGAGLKALVINGEDSTDEIRRRTYAFCLAHGIAERDLVDLTIAGADDREVQKISFLKTIEKGMSALNQDGLDALQLALDALHPDLIVLDPLVSFCAGGNMNDNAVMSLVMRKLKEIAARNQCAVLIVSHTRKGGDAGNVEAIGGAAAITNLARRAVMPAPLTAADAAEFAILPSERPQHFKLVDAKSNLAPRAVDAPLYRLVNVELPNPEPPLYPNGDNVQAITRVTLPIKSSGAVNGDDMKIEAAILDLVDHGKEIEGQALSVQPQPRRGEQCALPYA